MGILASLFVDYIPILTAVLGLLGGLFGKGLYKYLTLKLNKKQKEEGDFNNYLVRENGILKEEIRGEKKIKHDALQERNANLLRISILETELYESRELVGRLINQLNGQDVDLRHTEEQKQKKSKI